MAYLFLDRYEVCPVLCVTFLIAYLPCIRKILQVLMFAIFPICPNSQNFMSQNLLPYVMSQKIELQNVQFSTKMEMFPTTYGITCKLSIYVDAWNCPCTSSLLGDIPLPPRIYSSPCQSQEC